MATVIDYVFIDGLRPAHFTQLLSYLDQVEDSGIYSGNYKQFMSRHNDLREWLENIEKLVRSEGMIIPKRRTNGEN